jgi:hypothetical protein
MTTGPAPAGLFFRLSKSDLIPVIVSALRLARRGLPIPVIATAWRVAHHGTLARGQCDLYTYVYIL